MINRAGGKITNGKTFFWTNWYLEELFFNEPFFKNPSYIVVDEWLPKMFDDTYSGELMPMPVESWN